MKNILLILLTTVCVSANAQVKSTKSNNKLKLDSINLKGVYVSDTSKVVVTVLVDDGTIAWRKGYQIRTNFYVSAQNALPFSTTIVDHKFQPFKREELESIADVKPFNWK